MPSFNPANATTGVGSTLSIGFATGSSGSETFTLVGEITDMKLSGMKRATTSYVPLGNGGWTNKVPTTLDAGTVTVTCAYVPNDAGQLAVIAAIQAGVAYDFKLQSAINAKIGQTTSGDVRTFSAIVTEAAAIDFSVAKEQEFTFSLDIDGPMNFTAGS